MNEAVQFFEELGEFTKRWVGRYLPGKPSESPWSGRHWLSDPPKGAIIHYTADIDLGRVMNWFMNPAFKAKVSAHAVVCREWTQELRELSGDLPLVDWLSTPVLQPVGPEREAWHATWANGWAYGIENVNIGELQERGGAYFSWRPRDRSSEPWTTQWDTNNGVPVPLYGRFWAPYTWPQIDTNIVLLKRLEELTGCRLDRSLVLGHECVQANKRDPGPDCPVHLIRVGLDGVDDATTDYEIEDYGEVWREDKIRALLPDGEGRDWFEREVKGRLVNGEASDAEGVCFSLLGYRDTSSSGAPDIVSITVFQRMMGLVSDGILGPDTRKALAKRLIDRGLV